jgi:hypothetical protein
MDQYESDYQAIKTQLETTNTNTLPDLFCQLTKHLEQVPPQSEELQKQVQQLFLDVNTEIQRYNEQFQLLVKELGVLCRDERKQDLVQHFFQALLDLFRLASSVYQTTPEKLAPFAALLHEVRLALETRQWKMEGDAFQKALLLQLVTSAWILTRTEKEIPQYARTLTKQLQGGKRNSQHTTRKQRR